MIKDIGGLLYEVKSPALFELKTEPGIKTIVQVGYLGVYDKWAVRLVRDNGRQFSRTQMNKDEAFRLISNSYHPNR